MLVYMGQMAELFPKFIKMKLRERKAVVDGYNDKDFAIELGVEYQTVKRWLAAKSVKRIDFENLMAVVRRYPDEFWTYMESGGG